MTDNKKLLKFSPDPSSLTNSSNASKPPLLFPSSAPSSPFEREGDKLTQAEELIEMIEKSSELMEKIGKMDNIKGAKLFGEYSEGIQAGGRTFGAAMGAGALALDAANGRIYDSIKDIANITLVITEQTAAAGVLQFLDPTPTADAEEDEYPNHNNPLHRTSGGSLP